MSTKEKVYQYHKDNGKMITIKRTWTNSNAKIMKQESLKNYFNENADEIANMKSIKAIYDDYISKNQNNKISYSMLYHYYQSQYNTRKKQENPCHKSSEHSTDEEEIYSIAEEPIAESL